MATARVYHSSAFQADTASADSDILQTSIWHRIKTAAARVVRSVKRSFVKTTAVVAGGCKKAIRKLRLESFFVRIKSIGSRFWVRSLRPMLRAVALAAAVTGVVVCMFVNPMATIAVVAGLGLFLHLLAAIIERLEHAEASGSRAARMILSGFGIVERIVIFVMYLAAAAVAVAVCVTSLYAAIYFVLSLTLNYFAVPGATTISFVVSCVLAGDLLSPLVWLILFGYKDLHRTHAAYRRWQAARTATTTAVDAETFTATTHEDATMFQGDHLRAQGTEEFWETADDVAPHTLQTCVGCGEDVAHLVASQHPDEPVVAICVACAEAEAVAVAKDAAQAEVTALRYTGVSLTKRGVVVSLLPAGIEATLTYAQSRANVDHWHWLETAHYRPLEGATLPRAWSVLGNGVVQATVRYHYKRNVVQGFDLHKRLISTVPVLKGQNALERAVACVQQHVTDELDRRDNLRIQTEATTTPEQVHRAPSRLYSIT